MTHPAAPLAVIADDEPHLLAYLEEQLALAWPSLRIAGRAANGIEALRLVDELAPDVVFLDIQMPGLNGMQLAEKLCAEGTRTPRIVFTTAHEHYALQAFEQSAFDYLLKPIRLERLQRTVARLQETLAQAATASAPAVDPAAAGMLVQLMRQLGMAAPAPGDVPVPVPTPASAPLQWIRAAQGQETRLIAVDEVIYFQSNDKYTSVFVADGEHLIRTPLRQLREQLDPQQFWQIHRGVIVAARHVAGTRTDFRGRLLVRLKGREEQLVVSRNYVDLFRQM
ncbi:LytTR family DNA-binding domain-containing protein [Massilia sp. YIM B02763]|uniref:LytR/AlgR family response regulator transcription factor n=1 Tax=Massilia sp. YIM B02763 TaxID=3050130 RepID=UPI0025B66CC2|nr:LytTR family DNA-binding domain-containing protein [Massilia sp. YIM B02763]